MPSESLVKKDYTDEVDFSLGIMDLGKVIAASGYFKDVKSVSQAVMKVLAGRDMGISPTQSLAGVHIVEGKPTIGAHLMAAAIKAHPDYDYEIVEHTDKVCAVKFYSRMKSGKWAENVERFTLEDGRKAGLADRGVWKKYPRNMLFARVISNGVKFHCPTVFMGPVYVPEEMGAEVNGDGEIATPPDIQPAHPDSAVFGTESPEVGPQAPEVVDVAPEPVPDEPIEDAAPPEEQPPPPDDHVPPPEETGEEPPLPPQEVTYTHNYKQLHAKRRAAKLGTKELKEFGILKFKKDSAKLWTPEQFQLTLDWLDACEAAGEIINPNDFEG